MRPTTPRPLLSTLLTSALLSACAQSARTAALQTEARRDAAPGAPDAGSPDLSLSRPPLKGLASMGSQNPVGLQQMLKRIQRGTATPAAQQPIQQ